MLEEIIESKIKEKLRACDFDYDKAYSKIFGSSRKKGRSDQGEERVLSNS